MTSPLFSEPVKFWSVLNEMNLLPDVLDLMVRSLEQMRSHALSNPAQRDAGKFLRFQGRLIFNKVHPSENSK